MKGGRKKSKREKEAELIQQEDIRPENVELRATKVFFENMNCEAKIMVNRGSAGSSKSYSIGTLLAYKFASEKNKRILIIRKSLPSLRVSTLWMMHEIMDVMGLSPRIEEQKNQLNFLFNGNLIHFGSIDDPQKIKSTEWNYQWFEEATEFTQEDFNTVKLYNRRKSYDNNKNQIYLSFNPIDEYHWIKTDLLKEADEWGNVYNNDGNWEAHEIHSTYKDNPFLPEDYVRQLENLEFQDYNYYRVYALGEWGKVGDVIYTNYNTVKTIPEGGETVYGLDFGFNSPSALIRCDIFRGEKNENAKIFEEELLYKEKLTNSQLIQQMDKLIPEENRRRCIIYADSAEPDRIQEIKNAKLGFIVKAASKQVKEGIDFIKRLEINILDSSVNILKEKRAYGWKKDRNGRTLDEPIKFKDHCYDKETEILTDSGWKLFSVLTDTDKIMTLVDNKVVYEKPVKYIKQSYEGDMLRYLSKNLDFSITPDQLLWISNQYSTKVKHDPKFDFCLPESLPHTSFIKRNCFDWEGQDLNDFSFKKLRGKYVGDYSIDIIDFARFLGLWLAEGCVNKSHYAVIISGNGSAIEDVVKAINVPYHKENRNNDLTNRYSIMSKELYEYFIKLGKSDTKYIPVEFKNANKDILKALWEGYEVGDGYKTGKNDGACSVSYRLISDFQEVVFKLGLSSNVYKVKDAGEFTVLNSDTCNCKDVYRLSISNEDKGINGIGCVELVKSKIFKEYYDDYVYDVRTSSGIIVTRRNGRIMWTSNCMDAERYALYSHLKGSRDYTVRWIN